MWGTTRVTRGVVVPTMLNSRNLPHCTTPQQNQQLFEKLTELITILTIIYHFEHYENVKNHIFFMKKFLKLTYLVLLWGSKQEQLF